MACSCTLRHFYPLPLFPSSLLLSVFLLPPLLIRLLVNLTQPAYLCFSGALPKGKDSDAMRCCMEVEKYLRGYKEVGYMYMTV